MAPGGSPEVVHRLKSLRRLESVGLSGVPVGDEHIPAIVGMSSIEGLCLTATDVTDAGAKKLASL